MNKFIILILVILTLGCREKVNLVKDQKTESTSNSVFIIDVSASMLSLEFKPNRLENIKKMIATIINSKQENDYISLVVFSENSMVVSPLTNDKNKLHAGLKSINDRTYEKLGEGTSFNGTFQKAIYALEKVKSKSVFLFTDGVYANPNKENQISVETQQNNGIKTNVVILATNDIYNPPISRDKDGNLLFGEMKSPKVDTVFTVLAQKTNGSFTRIYNNNELNKFDIAAFFHNNKF